MIAFTPSYGTGKSSLVRHYTALPNMGTLGWRVAVIERCPYIYTAGMLDVLYMYSKEVHLGLGLS